MNTNSFMNKYGLWAGCCGIFFFFFYFAFWVHDIITNPSTLTIIQGIPIYMFTTLILYVIKKEFRGE